MLSKEWVRRSLLNIGLYSGHFAMHLILMHNSILLLQTLVLTRPMSFFPDFGVFIVSKTLDAESCSQKGKFIPDSCPFEYFLWNYLQSVIITCTSKRTENLFYNNMTMVIDQCGGNLIWLADGTMVRRIGHWKVPSARESIT